MTLTEISIKRPSLIIVLFSVLMLGGLYCYSLLSYELLPDFSLPTLTIQTAYPGASPADVEQSVTKKVEDVVSGLDGIKTITSQSMEGVSVITAEFVVGSDVDAKQQDAQRKINNILSDLPDDVKTPSISKITPSDQPIMQLSAVSTLPARDFYDLVKNEVVPQLQQIPGVGEISLLGGEEREIQVNVDKDKLDFYRVSLPQVTQAIKEANADFPTGKVKSGTDQMTVRLAGKFTSVAQLNDLVVATPANAAPVRLSQVASVIDASKDITVINRLNGREGLGIRVKKQGDANAVAISKQVHARIGAIEKKYARQGVRVTVADDSSEFTLESADAVTHDLVIAVVLVALVMLLFLHSLRDAGIVLVAIPASLLSTFIAMYLFGYTLNLMTLLAMSLVIGILVDDSIVVLENIHRHLSMGKDKVQAAIDGRAEIGFSAVAITMVDVVVFLPIAFINTTIGDILRQYAVTIVVSTLMSLLVCFTLTPWLASRFGAVTELNPKNWLHKPLIWFEHLLEGLNAWYVRRLEWALHHKIVSGLAVVASFGLMVWAMSLGILGSELIASGDRGKFKLSLEYDKSAPVLENNLRTRTVENLLLTMPEVSEVLANVGGAASGGPGAAAGVGSEYKSELTVGLVDAKQRSLPTADFMIRVRDQLAKRYPGLKVNTAVIGLTSADEPIQIILSSENQPVLMAAAQQLKNQIIALDGSNDVSVSVEDGNPEVSVQLNREKMARLGLSIITVGSTLQNAYTGNTDAQYQVGTNDYDIDVRLDAFDRRSAADVANFAFTNSRGELVRLSQFATVRQSSGPSMLERKDRRASVTVKANVLGISSGILAQNIDAALAKHPLPAGVDLKWGGDIERQADSFGALGTALLAALILVYLVMVALYDSFVYPFVVLFSMPVALIGAFLALTLSESTLSIFAILGVIMLIGLVMKNGILLVDFANQRKAEGEDTFTALLDAGRARLRPILMTTIAMVIGMLPIALAKGAGSEWKNGLAIVMIGGLLSSLVLTVFVVPIMFYVVDALKARFGSPQAAHLEPGAPAAVAA